MYSGAVPAYKYVKRRGHPLCPPSGRVPEHRILLWDKIGPGSHPCHWCSISVEWSTRRTAEGCLTVDHVDGDPRNNAPENLVPSCHSCNVTRARDRRFVDQPHVVEDGVRQAATEKVCQRAACGRTFLIATKHLRNRTKNAGRYCSLACMYARNH
jgi:hypothetical protein